MGEAVGGFVSPGLVGVGVGEAVAACRNQSEMEERTMGSAGPPSTLECRKGPEAYPAAGSGLDSGC